MNIKKIVALLATGTMLLATVPVSASSLTTETGNITTSSQGTVNAWDKTPIFKVTLPTANALQFTVDPYGLVDLASGGALESDLIANGAGTVESVSGAGAVIVNASSVPVVVNAKFYVTDTGSTIFTPTQAEAATGSASTMYLSVVPSASLATGVAAYSAATSGAIAITATNSAAANTASFRLEKANYLVQADGSGFKLVAADDGSEDGTVLKVSGYANPAGEWSAYSGTSASATLVLNAVFDYRKATDADVVASGSAVHGLLGSVSRVAVTDSRDKLTDTTDPNADYEAAITTTQGITFTVEDETIESVQVSAANNFASMGTNAKITNTANTVTFPGSTYGAANRYLKINFTSGKSVVIKLIIS